MPVTTTARTATEIASAAVAQAEAAIRSARRAAIAEWRELVLDIADGLDPNGDALQRIAELSEMLKFPRGVLANHVDAIQEDRRITGIVSEAVAAGQAADAAIPTVLADIQATEATLLALRTSLYEKMYQSQSGIFVRSRSDEHREKHPILFGDLDEVVDAV